MTDTITRTVRLEQLSAAQLKTLLGEYNNHIKYIQDRLDININQRQHNFVLSGDLTAVERGERILEKLADEAQSSRHITPEELHLIIQSSISRAEENAQLARSNSHSNISSNQNADAASSNNDIDSSDDPDAPSNFTPISLRTRKGKIVPRGSNQQRYVKRILTSDVSFGVEPVPVKPIWQWLVRSTC